VSNNLALALDEAWQEMEGCERVVQQVELEILRMNERVSGVWELPERRWMKKSLMKK
jgi:hypothetical protein